MYGNSLAHLFDLCNNADLALPQLHVDMFSHHVYLLESRFFVAVVDEKGGRRYVACGRQLRYIS